MSLCLQGIFSTKLKDPQYKGATDSQDQSVFYKGSGWESCSHSDPSFREADQGVVRALGSNSLGSQLRR